MVTAQMDLRSDLIDWRRRLEDAMDRAEDGSHLAPLLTEVDSALHRMEAGSYGICEACNDVIEDEAVNDPVARFCLECLSKAEQRALQRDLDSVSLVQYSLLPKQNLELGGWRAYYHYEAAGPVSGDYCDLVSNSSGDLLFVLGDVSGKGIAASMLMAHLHAIFRSLISLDLPINQLVERANRVFAESTMPAYYATLVCGRARSSGFVEICNAGHPPALLTRKGQVTSIGATGLPVGIFSHESYTSVDSELEPGDSVLLYTDGLTEARDKSAGEYGIERLARLVSASASLSAQALTSACLDDARAFRAGEPKSDDLTVMVIQRC